MFINIPNVSKSILKFHAQTIRLKYYLLILPRVESRNAFG